MLISDAYRDLNRELHARGGYGLSGHKWAQQVYALARQSGAETVLDYGCGQGTLARALVDQFSRQPEPIPPIPLPFAFLEYDPAIEGKETKPAHADLVVCGDVLEHIEPECLYAVLDDIAAIARKAVFLVVATRPAKKTLADGRNAHLIVEPAEWWLPHLIRRWRPVQFQASGGEFVFIGARM